MPKWLNVALKVVAGVVAAAGAVVVAPAAAVPAVVAGVAMKVVTYGTLVGIVAAKVLPGHFDSTPAK